MYHNIDASEVKATLKTMIRLLESNWKFDIYSQAADDLNVKKWNKVTMVPLAQDLKLLKEQLTTVANSTK